MKHFFDIDIDWVEETFSTIEPEFFKRLFETNIEDQAGITYYIFTVPIGNAKERGKIEYKIQAPLVAYYQNASNSCCLSSLSYSFTASGEEKYTRDIEMRIQE